MQGGSPSLALCRLSAPLPGQTPGAVFYAERCQKPRISTVFVFQTMLFCIREPKKSLFWHEKVKGGVAHKAGTSHQKGVRRGVDAPKRADSDVILFRFTAYLQKSISHSINDFCREKQRERDSDKSFNELIAATVDDEDVLDHCSFFIDLFENDVLVHAVSSLDPQHQYILYQRAIEERRFAEIGADLGLKCKSVASLYYRTLQKLKKEMDGNNGFQGIADPMPERRSRSA